MLAAARDAFSSGLNAAAATAAVIAGIGAILAATMLRHVPPTGTAAAAAVDDLTQTDGVAADGTANR